MLTVAIDSKLESLTDTHRLAYTGFRSMGASRHIGEQSALVCQTPIQDAIEKRLLA